MKFAVVTIAPPGYEHWRAFEEVSDALHFGLLRAGHESVRATNRSPAGYRPIVLGANLVPAGQSLPPDAIVFNLEQIVHGAMWLLPAYVALMQRHKVWDYSEGNVEPLKRLGVLDVDVVPIGYVPELTRIPTREKTVDVLFYGSGNPRRERILQDLYFHGAKVESIFGVYGAERDEWIARSRAVINIHFYESRLFEIVRIGYLLANSVFVVTEESADRAVELELRDGLAIAPYEGLVETTLRYLADDAARAAVARRGFEIFSSRDQSAALGRAIGRL